MRTYLICFRHFIRSQEQSQIRFFSPKRPIFLHARATLPSKISTMEEEGEKKETQEGKEGYYKNNIKQQKQKERKNFCKLRRM